MAAPQWLAGAAAGAIAGVAVGGSGVYWHYTHTHDQLAKRPPLAYIDTGTAASKAADTGRGDALIAEIRDKAGRLAEAGYIVVDAQALIDAPGGLEVPLTAYKKPSPDDLDQPASGGDDAASAE